MSAPLRVAILEDHPITVDGYRFRLTQAAGFEIVGVATYGEALEPMLERTPADLLLLDISTPTSSDNANPYPIVSRVPHLHQRWPNMAILIVTMHNESALIRAVMQAGASGYLLKEDQESLIDLTTVARSVVAGNIHLSPLADELWRRRHAEAGATVTARQLEALSLCAAYPDLGTEALAARMSVAPSTLRNLLSGAYLRLGVSTRAAAVAEARRRGLITPFPPSAPTS
jgi:DNA-binding NarL/FixJ family response regulator